MHCVQIPNDTKNKCINCTLAMFWQCRTLWHDGQEVTIESLASMSMDHPGKCYRTSNYSSASAEEFQATKAAEQLLFDKDGVLRSADTCVAISQVVADSDTRGPKNAIKRQNAILGNKVDGVAKHFPDLGHVIKNSSNEFFATRNKDSSFRGRQCLTNEKIKSIHLDISHTVKEYRDFVGNDVEQTKCLRQLNCIILHHCGNHSKCFQETFCSHEFLPDLIFQLELQDKHNSESEHHASRIIFLNTCTPGNCVCVDQ